MMFPYLILDSPSRDVDRCRCHCRPIRQPLLPEHVAAKRSHPVPLNDLLPLLQHGRLLQRRSGHRGGDRRATRFFSCVVLLIILKKSQYTKKKSVDCINRTVHPISLKGYTGRPQVLYLQPSTVTRNARILNLVFETRHRSLLVWKQIFYCTKVAQNSFVSRGQGYKTSIRS